MSYIARCTQCACLIQMEDDFDENDTRICEECVDDLHRFGFSTNAQETKQVGRKERKKKGLK